MRVTTPTNVSTLKALFIVADHIAKAKKPLIIGEELILPVMTDIYHEPFGEDQVKKVTNVPLLATTITRRIDEIADDVEAYLLERINESLWYAIQVDDSTDVDNKAILLVFFCDISFKRMEMRFYYEHYFRQPTPQLQNYLNP